MHTDELITSYCQALSLLDSYTPELLDLEAERLAGQQAALAKDLADPLLPSTDPGLTAWQRELSRMAMRSQERVRDLLELAPASVRGDLLQEYRQALTECRKLKFMELGVAA